MALVGAHCRHAERDEGQGRSGCCIQRHTEHSSTLLDTVSICSATSGLATHFPHFFIWIIHIVLITTFQDWSPKTKAAVQCINRKKPQAEPCGVETFVVLPWTSNPLKLSLNRKKGCTPQSPNSVSMVVKSWPVTTGCMQVFTNWCCNCVCHALLLLQAVLHNSCFTRDTSVWRRTTAQTPTHTHTHTCMQSHHYATQAFCSSLFVFNILSVFSLSIGPLLLSCCQWCWLCLSVCQTLVLSQV